MAISPGDGELPSGQQAVGRKSSSALRLNSVAPILTFGIIWHCSASQDFAIVSNISAEPIRRFGWSFAVRRAGGNQTSFRMSLCRQLRRVAEVYSRSTYSCPEFLARRTRRPESCRRKSGGAGQLRAGFGHVRLDAVRQLTAWGQTRGGEISVTEQASRGERRFQQPGSIRPYPRGPYSGPHRSPRGGNAWTCHSSCQSAARADIPRRYSR